MSFLFCGCAHNRNTVLWCSIFKLRFCDSHGTFICVSTLIHVFLISDLIYLMVIYSLLIPIRVLEDSVFRTENQRCGRRKYLGFRGLRRALCEIHVEPMAELSGCFLSNLPPSKLPSPFLVGILSHAPCTESKGPSKVAASHALLPRSVPFLVPLGSGWNKLLWLETCYYMQQLIGTAPCYQ